MSGGGEARLLVWSQGEVWRWTYTEAALNGGGPFRLDSSIAFPDPGEARSAAAVAFPGVPVDVRPGEAPDRGGPDRGGPRPERSLFADLALAAAVALVALAVPDRGRFLVRCAWTGRGVLVVALGGPAPPDVAALAALLGRGRPGPGRDRGRAASTVRRARF